MYYFFYQFKLEKERVNLGFKSVAGSTDILPIVEADLKRTSEKVLDRAREVCRNKSVRIQYIYIY